MINFKCTLADGKGYLNVKTGKNIDILCVLAIWSRFCVVRELAVRVD